MWAFGLPERSTVRWTGPFPSASESTQPAFQGIPGHSRHFLGECQPPQDDPSPFPSCPDRPARRTHTSLSTSGRPCPQMSPSVPWCPTLTRHTLKLDAPRHPKPTRANGYARRPRPSGRTFVPRPCMVEIGLGAPAMHGRDSPAPSQPHTDFPTARPPMSAPDTPIAENGHKSARNGPNGHANVREMSAFAPHLFPLARYKAQFKQTPLRKLRAHDACPDTTDTARRRFPIRGSPGGRGNSSGPPHLWRRGSGREHMAGCCIGQRVL
jgi:hypothetical protein